MTEEKKKEEIKNGVAVETPKMREILIKFDAKNIIISKAETASDFEFQAILENILRRLSTR
jgi:hypothetical protein